jgi:hypothetical protein
MLFVEIKPSIIMKLARCCTELKTLTNTVSVLFLILNNMKIYLYDADDWNFYFARRNSNHTIDK